MIRSFYDRATEAVFIGRCPKGFPADLFRAARRKLTTLNAAATLDDLKAPPSNRLQVASADEV